MADAAPTLLSSVDKTATFAAHNVLVLMAVFPDGQCAGTRGEIEPPLPEFENLVVTTDGWLTLNCGPDHLHELRVEAWSAAPPYPAEGDWEEHEDVRLDLVDGVALQGWSLDGGQETEQLPVPSPKLHARCLVRGRRQDVGIDYTESWLVQVWPLPESAPQPQLDR